MQKKKPGRPFGTKKEPTVNYHRRIKPEFVKKLDEYLEFLKNTENKEKYKDDLIC